jgi:glycosyltransferase involved in cell wall biosynthesis
VRITIVTGFFLPVPPLGGGATEKIWYGLAKIFASQGHSVVVISRRWPGLADNENVDGVRHLRLPGFNHTRLLAANLVLDFIWGIRATAAAPKADVIICNTISMPSWLHRLKSSAGKVAVMIGRVPKGQLLFYRDVARIYVPSTFVAGKVRSARLSKLTRVTGYPIDWPLHARSAARTAPPLTIGYIGRLNPEKGIALLVRAAIKLSSRPGLPEWRLRLVGPSGVGEGGGGEQWLGALKEVANRFLGQRVEWLPPEFDPVRLAEIYGSLDVFCYPSLAEKGETFGVSVAEAMAAGCAVVVSKLSCFSDLIMDGRNGLVFDHQASNAEDLLADRIAILLSDGWLRHEIANHGQAYSSRFDYPQVAGLILADLALLTGAGPEKR